MNNNFYFGISKEKKERLKERYVGKKIRIINMEGEPQYSGKVGVVEMVGTFLISI